jgi:hypothetical protein
VKIALTSSWERLASGFFGLVITQTPSRAIFVNTSPVGSTPTIGSREASPMSTLPALTSSIPRAGSSAGRSTWSRSAAALRSPRRRRRGRPARARRWPAGRSGHGRVVVARTGSLLGGFVHNRLRAGNSAEDRSPGSTHQCRAERLSKGEENVFALRRTGERGRLGQNVLKSFTGRPRARINLPG